MFDTVVAISVGIGLAAACGFRVFVPILIVGIAAKADFLSLAGGFEWIGSWVAIAAFGIATAVEIGGYYFPWLDNLLDSAATPAAVIAGIILSAAFIEDMHPLLKWSLAIIAGGGSAGVIKTGLVALRLGSTTGTGGIGNFVVSTCEWLAALALSILSILLPILAVIIAVILTVSLLRFALRLAARVRTRRSKEPVASDS
jgi:hypothetical protein